MPYVTAGSDLDLLVAPRDGTELEAALSWLTHEEGAGPLRLDGEIVFPGSDAVSWREWRDAPHDAHVLVKGIGRLALLPREALSERFARSTTA
jgi:phosphoribosyl-dephospho-CoA transferase